MKLMRFVARVAALAALVVLLLGVPTAVVVGLGVRVPTTGVHRAWMSRGLDGAAVIAIGGVLFVVLWAWFAVTALAEAFRVLRHRLVGVELAPTPPGPSGWVRSVVRFVALSGAVASMMGGLGAHGITTAMGHPGRSVSTGAASADRATTLSPSTIAFSDGEGLPSSTGSDGGTVSPLVSYLSGMGTAVVIAVGVIGMVESRRRRQWRTARDEIAVAPREVALVHAEQTLRSVRADEPVARLDAALRSVARDLVRQESRILAAALGPDGEVRLVVDGRPVPSVAEWSASGEPSIWYLAGEVSIERLAEIAGDVVPPCPAIVHLGSTPQGDLVFVDLEAIATLSLRTPFSDDVARMIATSLVVSPFMQGGSVVVCGTELAPILDGCAVASAVRTDTFDDAMRIARRLSGAVAAAARSSSTLSLRMTGASGESWEPTIVVATGQDSGSCTGADDVAGFACVIDGATGSRWSLSFEHGTHVLQPIGWHVTPVGIGQLDVADVMALVSETAATTVVPSVFPPPDGRPMPLVPALGLLPAAPEVARDESTVALFQEPPWSFMVQTLGPVGVVDRDGTAVQFERSKSLELVVWLALHRDRPTRSAARTALWDLDVRAATFANVVSDARRSLARAVLPLEGDEWIARTLTEDLPLHERVVTDADLLAARLEHARTQPDALAIDTLRPGVELLRSLPMSGTTFLWSDAEGHTSALVMLAMSAATELAERCLAVGDIDGVFWATGQGLKVLAGHEELIALRMRAHARRGDLAGVRNEWASYERALAADAWSTPDPAPKLVSLRRSLLG